MLPPVIRNQDEGEFQAAQRLRDAADVISPNPVALQLRYLQTLTELGDSQNSTIVFPIPLEVIRPLLQRTAPNDEPGPAALRSTPAAGAVAAADDDGALPANDPAHAAPSRQATPVR